MKSVVGIITAVNKNDAEQALSSLNILFTAKLSSNDPSVISHYGFHGFYGDSDIEVILGCNPEIIVSFSNEEKNREHFVSVLNSNNLSFYYEEED